MVFSSLSFIFFLLPLFLVSDRLSRKFGSVNTRNTSLLAVSLLFYIWGEAWNVFLLLALGMINFLAGKYMRRFQGPAFLAAIVTLNILTLAVVKYLFWLAGIITPDLLKNPIYMPLGISFFTFHAISYVVDVYRGAIRPARTTLDFLTYFCMFPHLVAGPIVRFAQVQDDLIARGPDRDLFAFGVYRFLLGLNKKVLIANSVAILADSSFTMSLGGNLHGLDAWMGILAYTMQIYFDFSGYSDMAIGLAALGGFRFEENFRRPYSSVSIRDFWRRWHISLSSWLRDYLYIPLGGSRGGAISTYRNLLLVFFICGLWHGANFTFVLWGVWHGCFLILERLPAGKCLEKIPVPLSRLYAMSVVIIGWVFFRAENLDQAFTYLACMFGAEGLGELTLSYHSTAVAALFAAVTLCVLPDRLLPAPTSRSARNFPFGLYLVQTILAVFSLKLLLMGMRNPFIYFNF